MKQRNRDGPVLIQYGEGDDVFTPAREDLLLASREAFMQAASLNPQYANAYHGWGTSSLELGDYDDAIVNLQIATQLDKENLVSWNNLIIAGLAIGQQPLVKKAYREIIQNKREDPEALYLRSLAAYNKGDFHQSIILFRNAYTVTGKVIEGFSPLRECLETERIALLLQPGAIEQLTEYFYFQKKYLYEQFTDLGRQARPIMPSLLIGACVATGITLLIHYAQSTSTQEVEKVGFNEGTGEVVTQIQKTDSEVAPAIQIAEIDTVKRSLSVSIPINNNTNTSSELNSAESVVMEALPNEDIADDLADKQSTTRASPLSEAPIETATPVYSLLNTLCAVREEELLKSLKESQKKVFPADASKQSDGQTSMGNRPSPFAGVALLNSLSPFYLSSGVYGAGLLESDSSEEGGNYNLKIGPMTFNFAAGSGLMLNDNIALTQVKQGDVIFNTYFGVSGVLPITDFSTFSLSISAVYAKYLNHDELDGFSFGVDPLLTAGGSKGTGLELQVLIDDWTLTLYNNVSISVDAFKQATISDLDKFAMLSNATGINAMWDLSDVQLVTDVSRTMTDLLNTPGFSHMNRAAYNATQKLSGKVQPWLNLGIIGSYEFTTFETGKRSDSATKGVGPTFDMEIGETLDLSGTYMRTWAEYSKASGADREVNTMSLRLTHSINALMKQYVSFSRTISPAYDTTSNFLISNAYNYGFLWDVSDVTKLSFNTNLQAGKEQVTQSYERLNFFTEVTHAYDKNIDLSFGINHSFKETADGRGDYDRSLINSRFIYKF